MSGSPCQWWGRLSCEERSIGSSRRASRRAPRRLLAVLLALCASVPLGAARGADILGNAAGLANRGGSDNGPVAIDADKLSYDQNKDVISAEGDVVVTHGTTVLAADRVDLDRKDNQASAQGSVVLEDPETRVEADSAQLDMDDETGTLEQGQIYIPRTRFMLGGAKLEKGVGQSYHIWNGHLTTCHCEDGPPEWSIVGEQMDLSLRGWGTIQHGYFRILDRPVLYLPYGLFPVNRDRQSGFLFPRFGYSNQRGFQYEQPFFWAINKTSDATVALDVESAARIGLLGEYRYLLSQTEGGDLTASYFNEHIRGTTADEVVDPTTLANPNIPENRGSVIGYAQQNGPGQSRIYAQPFLVSDDLFLREINVLSFLPAEALDLRTLRQTTSRLGIYDVYDWGLLKAEATWYQSLVDKQSRQLEPLPRLTLNARDSELNGRLRLLLNSELVYYYRAPLASGPRFDFAPQVTTPFRAGAYGYGDAGVQLRETTYYLTSNGVPTVPFPTGDQPIPPEDIMNVPTFQHRELLQATGHFNSELDRVFKVNFGGIEKLKHTIEPYTSYLYVPQVGQDELPLYDAVDRINHRNVVTYGILSRLLAKYTSAPATAMPPVMPATAGPNLTSPLTPPTTTAAAAALPEPPTEEIAGPPKPPDLNGAAQPRIQELARAWIQQSYSIPSPTSSPVPGILTSADEHFSGIDVGLRVTPTNYFGLASQVTYSAPDAQLRAGAVDLFLTDPRPIPGDSETSLQSLRPHNSLGFSYRYIAQADTSTFANISNISTTGTYRLTNNLAVSYQALFDANVGRFLDNVVGLRVISSCDCWVVDMAFEDRVNPNETAFRVQVSLVGLGSFGREPFRPAFGALTTPQVSTTGVGRNY